MTQQRTFQSFSSSLPQGLPRRVGVACLVGGASLLLQVGAIAQTAADLDPTLDLDSTIDSQEIPSAEELLRPVPMPTERPAATAPPLAEPTGIDSPAVMFEGNGGSTAPLSVNELMERPPSLVGGNAIDSSDAYNLGATRAPSPSSVVLSERSTGCQTTLERGQDLASICAPSASSGQSVTLGPVSIGSDGITINRLPSFDNFYNVTTRPVSQPSNGDRSLLFPLSIPAPITSLFGWRQHPIFGDRRFHAGIDLGAPMGTPVVAAFSGKVSTAEYLQGYGLTVILLHNDGTQETLYAHLSEIFVRPGEQVRQGEVVGRVGSTGNSTGPHLHFEVRELVDGSWVTLNPGPSLQAALDNFLNGFDTLTAQGWSKLRLQGGLAQASNRRMVWMPMALHMGQFAPVPKPPDLIPPEQMEVVIIPKTIPSLDPMVVSERLD
jgi:murein DD-endopeptidase MepM/ murein hydrolase activator NlpD